FPAECLIRTDFRAHHPEERKTTMTIHSRRATWALALALIVVPATSARSQMKYARGQNVAPAFEGWERNSDGTINMVFGYLNRNYEEQVDIPIGPNNTVVPGGDRGQPTHFYPRRQRFIFKVVVPKDWDANQKVVWTLTSHGRTDVAKGWLQPEWELNAGVYGKPVELTTKASFSAPGTYLLRAIASDGQMESIYEVTVTVNPAGSAQNR